jgi:chromosome segregation ATPase
MSQTETLMVLGLGAAITLVLVLLFGRVLWSWAVSGAARKQAKRVPIEMLELQADRDRLRAEHAVMARKLDLRLDDIKVRMAEQMAEVSRHRNRIQNLTRDLQVKNDELEDKEGENRDLSAQLDATRAELDAAHRTIDTLNAQSVKHETDMARLQSAFKKLNAKVADRRDAMDSLNGELRTALGQDPAPAEVASDASPAERLRKRTAEIASISADMNRATTDDMLGSTFPPAERPEEKSLPDAATARLRDKMDEAVLINDDLQREIREIDELIGKTITHDIKPHVEDMPIPKRVGTVANVISLAQRIRALQKNIDE